MLWGFELDGLLFRIIGAFLIIFGSVALGIHKWLKTRVKNDYNNVETELTTQESCDVETFSEEEIIHLKNELNDSTNSEDDVNTAFQNPIHAIKLTRKEE